MSEQFLQTFFDQLIFLKKHNYIWQNQKHHFNSLKFDLPSDTVLCQIDFAENLTAVYQDEVQSKYFFKDQITLHNVVVYFRGEGGLLETRSMSVISDHLDHSTGAVQCFLKHVVDLLTQYHSMLQETDRF